MSIADPSDLEGLQALLQLVAMAGPTSRAGRVANRWVRALLDERNKLRAKERDTMDTWNKPPVMGHKPSEAREDELTAQTLCLVAEVDALAVRIRATWEGTDLAQVADFHARKLAQTCGDIRSWLGGVE